MALTQTQVSQLYVAIFGRSSEGEGNTYWQTRVEGMSATATAMLENPAAIEYFGDNLDTNEKFISAIYLNTLGKTATEDPDGIAFWVGLLNDGMSKGEVVAALIEAAQDPKNAGPAQDMFNNKVTVSNYTADNIAKADVKDLAKFSELNNSVTSDPKTVEAAEKAVDEMAKTEVTGETKYLEVTQDKLDGTAGNDLFVADVAQNQNGQQVNTLGSGDIINGGAGNDTLDATLIAAYNVAGKAMDITPTTNSVENIIINAQISDNASSATDKVILNARKMTGIEKISSKYSDADLLVKNLQGGKNTDGTKYISKDMTIGMEYTGNKDSKWDEANLTVLFDQDYLTRNSEQKNGQILVLNNADNLLSNTNNGTTHSPLEGFESFTFTVGAKLVKVEITGLTTYAQLVDAINAKLTKEGLTTVKASALPLKDAYYFDTGVVAGKYNEILIENEGSEAVNITKIVKGDAYVKAALNSGAKDVETETTNIPLSINVDLEKVGLAADGGALIIGSMNKDGQNKFNVKQKVTTTDTLAGFDEFNVTVSGSKQESSSLSKLVSTDNTLRKVTIDSAAKSTANLTIGNSNTNFAGGVSTPITTSLLAANAFKDVQVVDASAFKGNLTLNAGITADITKKYLNNDAKVNFAEDTGLSFKGEVALFDYNGGAGNDVLNIFIDEAAIANTFVGGTKNVFEMDINGGAGNDKITVTFDGAAVLTTPFITNISINGGAGNDIIDISNAASVGSAIAKDGTGATFTVAFNGNFGNDKIIGFNAGAITTTDEVQSLVTTGITVHTNETVVVKIGDAIVGNYIFDGTKYTVGANTYNTLDALLTAELTTGSNGQFTSVTGAGTLALTATGKNVETVTVDVLPAGHTAGSYDSTSPIHSVSSTTTAQGGLLSGATGADTLDFSAYNVKGVVVDRGATDLFGTDATVATQTAAQAALFGVASGANVTTANKFIYLEVSAHDSSVYNVYEATTKVGGTAGANIDFGTTGNATKGNVIGSIDLVTDTLWTTLDASQLLF
ncbi:DUF4214 domain-containing protein [Aliarcobacter cryaerophilus]|uniref:DUF4214 domain-containing protein n=1 Tax=Aliarcobacter cryaerophilus TaxID=28198 RepID=UPI003DA21FD3